MSSRDAVHPECLVTPEPAWLADGCQQARKPDGGFLKRPLATFLLPWWAYQHDQLGLEDLHVWLGVQELIERRCQKEPDTPAHYTLAELQQLLQAPRRAPLERAIARLEEVGLLTWTPTALHVLPHPQRLEACDPAGFAALRAALPPKLTWVPVPRRLAVWLARDGQPGLIATALGVLVRCMRYRQRQCIAGGRVAAGWIARVFGVAERTVHRSLQALEACGWLARRPEGPAQERQHGRYTVLNLHWERPGMAVRAPREGKKATGDEASPAQRREEPPERLGKVARPEPCRTLSPLSAGACHHLSPLPEQSVPGTTCQDRHSGDHQGSRTTLQPFQEMKRQRPKPAERRLTGVIEKVTAKREEHPSVSPQPTRPQEDGDDTTVTDTEYTVATASLVAQGLSPAFCIRPTVLAEVQRLRQRASASPVPTPVLATSALPVQVCGTPASDVVVEVSAVPVPSGPVLSAAPPASSIADCHKPPSEPVPLASAQPAPQTPPSLRPPSLAEVTPADLRDVGRLLALYQHATARDWLRGSEAERLQVVAAAGHALRVGAEPCKLFVWLLKHQAWEVITQDDEDQARQRLRAHDWGPCQRPVPAMAEPAVPALSAEARFVQQAVQVLRQAGWRGEPFLAVKLYDPTWTRQRWDAAQAELGQWRQRQSQRQRGCQGLGRVASTTTPARWKADATA